jgi:hypothetical protein
MLSFLSSLSLSLSLTVISLGCNRSPQGLKFPLFSYTPLRHMGNLYPQQTKLTGAEAAPLYGNSGRESNSDGTN